jgi:type IV pilus assembly protein PilZ
VGTLCPGLQVSTSVNPHILWVSVQNRHALHGAYMPFIRQCGLFIPTYDHYSLGDELFIVLDLFGEAEPLPVSAKVVWINPFDVADERIPGVGVKVNSRNVDLVAQKIASYLQGAPQNDYFTYTM